MRPVPLERQLAATTVVQLASGSDDPHGAGVLVVDIRAVNVLPCHWRADPGDDVAVGEQTKVIGGEVVVEDHAISDNRAVGTVNILLITGVRVVDIRTATILLCHRLADHVRVQTKVIGGQVVVEDHAIVNNKAVGRLTHCASLPTPEAQGLYTRQIKI